MTDEMTRLNIERARDALARARMDQASAAVRSPRPADLSRLQEDQARRVKIDQRATEFRGSVRDRLGLGEYRGSGVSVTQSIAHAMSAPLCDADVCAPAAPMTPIAPRPELRQAAELAPVEDSVERTAAPAEIEPKEPTVAELPDVEAAEPAPKRRRKFLGLF